jgi:subtilisin family serine protease
MLVGKPGTANHGITVGAFARHDGATRFRTSWVDVGGQARSDGTAVLEDISEFSSPGPTRDGRVKPELAAPGERVWGALSEEAHPCRSPHSVYRYHGFGECDALVTEDTVHHGFGLLQGTSFAAPVVTGLAARVLSTNGDLDGVQVRNVLVSSALVDGFTGPVPNEEWGYGKADLTVGGATLPADLRVTTDALPDGVVDEEYGFFLAASGEGCRTRGRWSRGTFPPAWGSMRAGRSVASRPPRGPRPSPSASPTPRRRRRASRERSRSRW